MGKWSGARLRGDWDHLCGTRARASFGALRRERDEDRVRSGVGASGERSHRRSAGSDRSSGVRCPRCGHAAVLRSADVLVSGSTGPCWVDAAGVRDHRFDAARGPGNVCKRGHEAGLRRIGDTRGLGRRDHSGRVELGWHRSPRSGHRRRWRLRGCGGRLVASSRPLHPHDRAPVRVLHWLRHRGMATGGCCCENGGKPSVRSGAPERSPTRLGTTTVARILPNVP